MAEKKKSAPVSSGPVKPEDKKKALETALAQIEKNFGKGAIMRLGDDIPVNVEAISTGSLSLDLALGIGGLPKGRIVEIYGPESSGKTTLALHVLAQAQKAAIMATARSRARIFFIVFSSLSKFVSVCRRLSPVMALFKRADRRKSI